MTTDFKVGEVVEFLGCTMTSQNPNQQVTIRALPSGSRNYYVKFPNGIAQYVKPASLKKLNKVTTDEPYMATLCEINRGFIPGDRVERINQNYDQRIKIGATGTVVKLMEKGQMQVHYDESDYCTDARTLCVDRQNHKLLHTNAPQQQKETPNMSLKITTSHTVQGKETKELSASTQASLIKEQQNKIKALQDVEPKTKKITASLKELREELATFVAHLDSLPE